LALHFTSGPPPRLQKLRRYDVTPSFCFLSPLAGERDIEARARDGGDVNLLCRAAEVSKPFMNALSTLVIAISLSADSFAVAACKGAALGRPKPLEALRTGAIFGAVQAVAPVLGWALGEAASGYVAAFDHWIAFLILAALGVKMILDGFNHKEACDKRAQHTAGALIAAAVSTSIDAVWVGLSLAFIDANIWMAAAIIGITTFLVAALGVMIGNAIGRKIGKIAEVFGGVVLIAVGTMIVLEHLGLV